MATGISAIGGVLILVFALADITTRVSILAPAGVFAIGFALTMAPMTAGAMSNFQHMAGRASSLLGFIHQGTGALVILVLSISNNGTQMPMALTIAVCSFVALAAYHILVRRAPLKKE